MSLFSSFDALCAESTGWKIFSWPTSSSSTQFDLKSSLSSSPSPSDSVGGDRVLKREISALPEAPMKVDSPQIGDQSRRQRNTVIKKRNPRFAVELDGVHCFETVVPF